LDPGSFLPNLPTGARILIIRLRSIGDIVLLTPALRLLKEWRPDLRISVMVEARFRELLQGNPTVEEILIPWAGTGVRKLVSRLAVIRELRRRGFALSVNLHGGPSSRQFVRWSGAPWRVGFAHYRGASLYNLLVPDAKILLHQQTVHTAEHQAAAFFYLGLPRQEIPRAQLFCAAGQAAWWEATRTSLEIPPGRAYAIVHPTALYKTKEWSPEGFARLGEYLESEAGLTPIYSCGPGEAAVVDAVEKAAGKRVRRLEGATLAQFAAALAGARLFVGNDSGPAHMAAALGRPLVVIFGSSSSPTWGPWPRPADGAAARVVQNPFDCNPCPGDRCYKFARPECILSVTFDQVKSAVQELLAQV
jgi:ADP-heptose:LPS heptosyltransferase